MSAASPPGSAPKAMSSRLLTMKFMQRAANSSPTHAVPLAPEQPYLKRQKRSRNSSPPRDKTDSLADRNAVAAALASEEAKREAAVERQATEAGDTRWVLSFEDQPHSISSPPLALRIVEAGFAHLDASPSQLRFAGEELDDKPALFGRRSFGRFNRVLEKQQNPTDILSDSDPEKDEDDEDSEDSEDDSDNPTRQLIKAGRKAAGDRARVERKAKKRKAKEEMGDASKKRRKNQVNLNDNDNLENLTSLSGKSEPVRRGPRGTECYNCGGPHYKSDCPNPKRTQKGGDDGRPRKARKAR